MESHAHTFTEEDKCVCAQIEEGGGISRAAHCQRGNKRGDRPVCVCLCVCVRAHLFSHGVYESNIEVLLCSDACLGVEEKRKCEVF